MKSLKYSIYFTTPGEFFKLNSLQLGFVVALAHLKYSHLLTKHCINFLLSLRYAIICSLKKSLLHKWAPCVPL